MKGTFSFYEDGKLVAQKDNLITTAGKPAVLRYLAKMSNDYAGAIGLGIDSTAATVGDTALGLEVARIPVAVRSVDYTNQDIIFKGTLDVNFQGNIYEAGLLSIFDNQLSGSYQSKVITTFDASENWTNVASGTVTTTDDITGNRVGVRGIKDELRTNTTGSSTHEAFINLDLSGYSPADQIAVGFISYSANTRMANINVTFTDINGYTATKSDQALTASDSQTTYQIFRWNKSTFTTLKDATGAAATTFDWSNIYKITVVSKAGASASSSPYGLGTWDVMAVIDKDTINPDYVLVSRVASGTPALPTLPTAIATKTIGKTMDVEYKLRFNL